MDFAEEEKVNNLTFAHQNTSTTETCNFKHCCFTTLARRAITKNETWLDEYNGCVIFKLRIHKCKPHVCLQKTLTWCHF